VKTVRNISIGLLFILSAWNFYLGISTNPLKGYMMYFVFGAAFLTLGAVLVSKIKAAPPVGLIISVAILFLYPMMADLQNFTPWTSGIMAAVDAIVIICCLVMVLVKIKN
jgi:hypothetical protein